MGEVSATLDACGKRCRHYNFLRGVRRENECGIGHPIRRIVTEKAGTDQGMVFMLPCTAPPNPVAECPDYDPKTDEEIAAQRAEMSAHMDKVLVVMSAAAGWRKKMIANNLPTASVTCPSCGEKDAMKVSCALEVNNHLRCHCSNCEIGFME
ncbi:hypothetical protein [uncultured Maritimibacter sp.]|uniref:hypothetical protein n=1 Tax=uncultured Maritimibacter sp. TaxID=991866 RepID=UPI0025923F6D|nr:hypothetical protein [uncultured Maritimibacter sp.]